MWGALCFCFFSFDLEHVVVLVYDKASFAGRSFQQFRFDRSFGNSFGTIGPVKARKKEHTMGAVDTSCPSNVTFSSKEHVFVFDSLLLFWLLQDVGSYGAVHLR